MCTSRCIRAWSIFSKNPAPSVSGSKSLEPTNSSQYRGNRPSCVSVVVRHTAATVKQKKIAMVSQRLKHTIGLCDTSPLYRSKINQHTAQTSLDTKRLPSQTPRSITPVLNRIQTCTCHARSLILYNRRNWISFRPSIFTPTQSIVASILRQGLTSAAAGTASAFPS